MLAILVGLAIGIGLPMQTSINSRLRNSVGSPFGASLISFAVGTLFLAIMTLIDVHTLGFSTTLFTSQPVWIWLGGLLGVVYLTGNILLFPKLGSVQTVIMPVLGQILAGLLIDNFGWFDSPQSTLTMTRFLGAILVLAGVIITVAAQGWLEQRHNRITEIAEKDLGLRGPGDFFGIRQSGEMSFSLGDIYQDASILQDVSEDVQLYLQMPSNKSEIFLNSLFTEQTFVL